MYASRWTHALAAACSLAAASAEDKTVYGVAKDSGFNTLVAAVDAGGLKDALEDPDATFTVFAPTDDAFAKVQSVVDTLLKPEMKPQLADLLQYHVLGSKVMSTDLTDGMTAPTLNGENITINLDPTRVNEDSAVTTADVAASNGVIHVVDAVLTPVSVTSSVVDIAAATPDTFSTLVAAVKAAGLAETLGGPGPFTVFAPTNDAFAAVQSTVDDLLKPENKDQLVDVLKYHVVSGNIPSSAVTTGDVATLEGSDLSIVVDGMVVKINDSATVTQADILANNGIIHVIDAVLLPPSDDAGGSATTGATAAPGATTAATDAATTGATTAPEEDGAATQGVLLAAMAVVAGAAALV